MGAFGNLSWSRDCGSGCFHRGVAKYWDVDVGIVGGRISYAVINGGGEGGGFDDKSDIVVIVDMARGRGGAFRDSGGVGGGTRGV